MHSDEMCLSLHLPGAKGFLPTYKIPGEFSIERTWIWGIKIYLNFVDTTSVWTKISTKT